MTRILRGNAARASFLVVLGLVSAAAAMAPGTAHAQQQEANGFGEKSQLILSVDRLMPLFSYSSQSVTFTRANGVTDKSSDSGTSMAFFLGREPNLGVVHTVPRVAFDFTIIRHLTLGGAFAFAIGLGGSHEETPGNGVTTKRDASKTTVVGFAPRVGYIIPLGDVFAFWPRAGFAFYSVSTKTPRLVNAPGPGQVEITETNSDSVFSLDLDPQFAWTPVQHFFIHFGPLVNIPLSGSRSAETVQGPTTTTEKADLSVFHFGLSAGLGGWFDL